MLIVRLVPLFPFAIVNYGAGVSAVRFRPYLAATAIGIVPGTLAYAGIGVSLHDPSSPVLWSALAGLLALTVGGAWAARVVRSRATPPEDSAGDAVRPFHDTPS